MNTDSLFLQKIAEFTTMAVNDIQQLKEQVKQAELREKQAEERQEAFEASLKKAAKALYESDFITDEVERKDFIKKAKEDPSFLSDVIEKVCNAADVSLIGKPARVAARDKTGEYDPVMARAFGWNPGSSNVFDT